MVEDDGELFGVMIFATMAMFQHLCRRLGPSMGVDASLLRALAKVDVAF